MLMYIPSIVRPRAISVPVDGGVGAITTRALKANEFEAADNRGATAIVGLDRPSSYLRVPGHASPRWRVTTA